MIVAALLFLLVLGVPIAISFSLIVLFNAERWNIDAFSLASLPFDTVSNFALLAIPLFLLVGELMNRGGLVRQLTLVFDIFMSRIRAPMGHIMIMSSALMGAITGSSVATVAAIGGTVGAEMRRRGYSADYTAALNAASGLLGVLIPPSIPLILYGAIVGVSITQLFIASIVPGLLTIFAFSLIHFLLSRKVLQGSQETSLPSSTAPAESRAAVIFRALPALILPVLVLGGIYSGVFTATEAAAIAGIYALAVVFISRQASFRDLKKVLEHAALASAAILVVIAFTSVFNRAMILEQVPQSITTLAVSFTDNPILFLLAVNAALLLIGMFMETNAATLLMGPLLAPAAVKYGIDPVHFGVILVTNIEIGLLTPPLAANLYVAQRTNSARLTAMFGYVMWFLMGALIVLALITFVPFLTTWYQLF